MALHLRVFWEEFACRYCAVFCDKDWGEIELGPHYFMKKVAPITCKVLYGFMRNNEV